MEFSDNHKLADISPIFKKEDSFKKENYRPVSILEVLEKTATLNIHSWK